MVNTVEAERTAHIALTRFGLGAKPGAISRLGAHAKDALIAELETPGIALITDPALPGYEAACQVVHTVRQSEVAAHEDELTARLRKHLQPDIGFVERLVLFFSNHFSVSVAKDGAILATAGQLERGVIRANVLGSFEAMLLGVMQHPAMQCYLDNDDSIGPNSAVGQSRGLGVNQNLAREILELHTLGVGGGYTEADIAAFAAAISGWSFVRGWEVLYRANGGTPENRGQFIFRPDWHEPGPQTILGKSYAQSGVQQGEAILIDLAHHRLTSQFLAFKLVRHFITDEPTPDLIDPVARAFRRSGGDIKAMARALIDLPAAWTLPLAKARTPYELQVAEMRALRRLYKPAERWPFNAALQALQNMPWMRTTPDGYPEETDYWIAPDAVRIRMETAQLNARKLMEIAPFPGGARHLASRLFGTVLSDLSSSVLAEAPDLATGLALLFMLPEFQRR